MAERMEKTKLKYPFIVITGPESTGKTELAAQLAEKLGCEWIPELSREYIAQLDRNYTYEDVENIARLQIDQFKNYGNSESDFVIFDTGLIITKVWFDVVYQKCPDWLIGAIEKLPKVLHLVCATDLPWMPDPVRENGGPMRDKLLAMYKAELMHFQFPFQEIYGTGSRRLENALATLTKGYIS